MALKMQERCQEQLGSNPSSQETGLSIFRLCVREDERSKSQYISIYLKYKLFDACGLFLKCTGYWTEIAVGRTPLSLLVAREARFFTTDGMLFGWRNASVQQQEEEWEGEERHTREEEEPDKEEFWDALWREKEKPARQVMRGTAVGTGGKRHGDPRFRVTHRTLH